MIAFGKVKHTSSHLHLHTRYVFAVIRFNFQPRSFTSMECTVYWQGLVNAISLCAHLKSHADCLCYIFPFRLAQFQITLNGFPILDRRRIDFSFLLNFHRVF